MSKTLPNRKTWQDELSRLRGVEYAGVTIEKIEKKYEELLQKAPSYPGWFLQVYHFEKNILPAVALYSVLKEAGDTADEALKLVDALLEAKLVGQKRVYSFWGKMPFFFDMIRLMMEPMMKVQYPKAGWDTEYPRLGRDIVALDEHSCFYLRVLTGYGMPELTAHFCRLDDYLFEGVSPYVRWERQQTLGRGGQLCDFRYYRVKSKG